MASAEAASAAIAALSGYELDSRALTVNQARPRAERGNRGGRDSRDRHSAGSARGNRW